MWECCSCVNLNSASHSSCSVCGHKRCELCSDINIPKEIKNDNEKTYFFHLEKFYQNDKKIDPIEKAKLVDMRKEYGINDKTALKILSLSSASSINPLDIGIGSIEKKSIVKDTKVNTFPKNEVNKKEFKPSAMKTAKKAKKSYVVILIILVLLAAPAVYIYFKKPVNYITKFPVQSNFIKSIAFSADGKYLIALLHNKMVVLDVKTGKKIFSHNVEAADINLKTKQMLIVSPPSLGNLSTGKKLIVFKLKDENIINARFLYNGQYAYFIKETILTGIPHTEIHSFYTQNGAYAFKRVYRGIYTGCSSDAGIIFTYLNNELSLYSVLSGVRLNSISTDNFDTSSYYRSQDNSDILISNLNRSFKCLSPNRRYVIYSISKKNYIIDLKTKKVIGKPSRYLFDFFNKTLQSAAFSPDGNFFALGFKREIHLWKNVVD